MERSIGVAVLPVYSALERDTCMAPSVSTNKLIGDLAGFTDEELIGHCGHGQQAALEELVRRHQTPIYRFMYRLLASAEDAEEASMDVFVRAWNHASRFQYRSKVATWLYRIAVNIARDIHSKRKSRPTDPWPESEAALGHSIGSAEDDALLRLRRVDESKILTRALDKLGDCDRLLLVLYYLEEKDYDEIQAIANLSYTVLKTRLARARRRLRDILEREDGEIGR